MSNKKHRLFLLRHGIRGFPQPGPPTPPISSDPACVLLLASHENLSRKGHNFCFKAGQYIYENFGKPNFIYGDISTPRTIDSSISLGLGAKVETVHFSTQDPDPFYQTPRTITPETIAVENQLLQQFTPEINCIKQLAEKAQPCLTLANSSAINPETGELSGLVLQEYVLGSTMLFAELSKLPDPLLKYRDEIAQIETIVWTLRTATVESVATPATILLTGISYFLQQYELSVLIGHEHNILQISRLLGKDFKLPDYPDLWVQANSGFIFTLNKHSIRMDILYLTPEGEFKTKKYLKIAIPIARFPYSLVTKTIY